jgi:regulator of protease activity HflC (stomatin/prohibitin superfamily)
MWLFSSASQFGDEVIRLIIEIQSDALALNLVATAARLRRARFMSSERERAFPVPREDDQMAKKRGKRKYSRGSQKEVENEMHRYKRGKAKSGRGGKGKVKSRKQAIAIGLSKARKKGKKVPTKR